ncbi:hypothetical protein ACWGTO_07545 [Mesorhizobium sp. PL10]
MNAPVGSLKPFGIPEGIDPRTWRRAIEKELNALFDKATALITALDVMEADCDLEDGADSEPWLGWTDRGPQTMSPVFSDGRGSPHDDREQDNSDYEDDGTLEPSLGAPERHPWSRDADPLSGLAMPRSCFTRQEPGQSQEHWADGSRGDHEREVDHDREADPADYDCPGVIWGGNESPPNTGKGGAS